MEWYIIFNGQQVGPLNFNQLPQYGLNRNSMVWHIGLQDWQPAWRIPELASLLAPNYGGAVPPQYNAAPNPGYGAGYNNGIYNANHNPASENGYVPSGKRLTAGILSLLIGGLGIQYFICDKPTAGILTIFLSIFTLGIWGLVMFIQGILILCMSDYDFDTKYVYTDKSFPLF